MYFIHAVAPRIVSHSSDRLVNIRLYRKTTLTCKADGVPSPNINWKKEGNNTVLPSVDGTLTLTNLKPQDMGRYICMAFNSEGNASASTYLTLNCEYMLSFFKVILEYFHSCKAYFNCRFSIHFYGFRFL